MKIKTKTMLEYSKIILQKVSFDKRLFKKELLKSLSRLNSKEAIALQAWTLMTFSKMHGDVLQEIFDFAALN